MKLLFDENLSYKLARRVEDLFPDSIHVRDVGMKATEDTFTCSAAQCANTDYTITVSVSVGPPPEYTVTATASGSQASDGNLTLDNLGTKTPASKWK